MKSTDTSEPVALVGFGLMGRAMARELLAGGYRVRVHDIAPDAEERARTAGCEFAGSPALAARGTKVALISLPRPEDVRDVVTAGRRNLLSAMQRGSVIVDTSTVSPQCSRDNAADAAQYGVGYLDCPVLGRPNGAGKWTLPVGGESADLETARPVLECLADRILPVGPSGQGNTIKLLNNLMFGAINSITCEVFALAEKLDVDPGLFFDTIATSGAATVSNLFLELGAKIVDGDFEAIFSVDNLHKDMSLGIAMANDAGIDLMISENNQRLIELSREHGLSQEDTAAIVRTCARIVSTNGRT